MIATPNKKLLNISAEAGSTVYISAWSPVLNGLRVVAVPEMSPKATFTLTDLRDGTVADEYLRYNGDHYIISAKRDVVTGKTKYEGVVVSLTNIGVDEGGERFVVTSTLTHEDCILLRNIKSGVTVNYFTYAGLANVSLTEEDRFNTNLLIQENTVYL